jgi:hypothetical protein
MKKGGKHTPEVIARMQVPMEKRLLSKIDKHGPLILETHCWTWTGSRKKDGHGQIWTGQTTVVATRALWTVLNGPIPDGLVIRHRCDNPPCMNPEHLSLGTPKQNSLDAVARGRVNKDGRKLSPEVRRGIAALRESGMTIQAVAEHFKISPKTVVAWQKRGATE